MNVYEAAARIADWGAPRATKDVDISTFGTREDLPRVLDSLERAVRSEFDFEYVRGWLVQMIPPGDRRIALLDDLEQRFGGA